jgi:MFS family permease
MSSAGQGGSRNLILAAMIFAVAMTFIDQTIVSIAAPEIQKELHLTSTGVQWAINAYLLSLAALFAFGGRLADTVGHRRMVTLGVVVFAGASAMCGFLTQWTWRAIFWVNIPVAIIALILIVISKPVTVHRPARMDYRGLALIASGVGLSVFGFQQSSIWGWSDPAIWACIAAGVALLIVFYFVELQTASPLMQVKIFRIRPFLVENLVLAITMLVFIPVFFFASEYAQIGLGKTPSEAGEVLLYFFIGFVIASQIGGRMLDRIGAKRPVVTGCVLGAVGFWLWARKVTGLDFSAQQWDIILAGAGMGFMLGPASTDAVNRASKLAYGEATGITQTVRNYSASLGLAILGTILVSQLHSRLYTSFLAKGLPSARAHAEASSFSNSQSAGGSIASIPHFVRLDFAYATRSVLYVMAAIMAAAAIVALVGLQRGVQEEVEPAVDVAATGSEGEHSAGAAQAAS